MNNKIFEIKERNAFVLVLCTELSSTNAYQHSALGRCGYDVTELPAPIIMARLDGTGRSLSYPPDWRDRTFQAAHKHIYENWNKLKEGDIIDVEFIHGEVVTRKEAEL